MDNSFNEFYRYNCVLHDYQQENDELKKEIERLNEENKKLKICNLEKSKLIISLNKRKNFYVKALKELMDIILGEDE